MINKGTIKKNFSFYLKNSSHTKYKLLKKQFLKDYQYHLIIIIPVIYMIIFHYLPMYGVQIAFKNYNAIKGIIGSQWVGFVHFERFFNSPVFSRLMINTIVISVYSIVAGFPIPIILALSLNSVRNIAFKKTVQMVTYAPHFISTVVLVGMMYQFFSTKYGAINIIIKFFGGDPIMFMGEASWFRHMFVWSNIWQNAGWGTIIYMSALAGINQSLYEASIVDGASRFKRMIYIEIPSLMPTIITLLILNFGRIMNVGFEKVLLMQTSTNMQKSDVIATYVYQIGLNSALPNFSYAGAIGLFNSVINFTLIIIVNWISRRISETSLW